MLSLLPCFSSKNPRTQAKSAEAQARRESATLPVQQPPMTDQPIASQMAYSSILPPQIPPVAEAPKQRVTRFYTSVGVMSGNDGREGCDPISRTYQETYFRVMPLDLKPTPRSSVGVGTEDLPVQRVKPLPHRQASTTERDEDASQHPAFPFTEPKSRFHKAKLEHMERGVIAEYFRAAAPHAATHPKALYKTPRPEPTVSKPQSLTPKRLEFRQSLIDIQEPYLLHGGWKNFRFDPPRYRKLRKGMLPPPDRAPGSLKRKHLDEDSDDESAADSADASDGDSIFAAHPDKRRRMNPCDIPSRSLLRSLCQYYADDVNGLVNIARVLDVLFKMGFAFVEDAKQLYLFNVYSTPEDLENAAFRNPKLTQRLDEILIVYRHHDYRYLFRIRPEYDPHRAKLLLESETEDIKGFFNTGCGVTPSQVIKWYYSFTDTLPTWDTCLYEFVKQLHKGSKHFLQFLKDLYARFSFVYFADTDQYYMLPNSRHEEVVEEQDILDNLKLGSLNPVISRKGSHARYYAVCLLSEARYFPISNKIERAVTTIPTFIYRYLKGQEGYAGYRSLQPVDNRDIKDKVARLSQHPFILSDRENGYYYADLPRLIPPPRSINHHQLVTFFHEKMKEEGITDITELTVQIQTLKRAFIEPYDLLIGRKKAQELFDDILDEVAEQIPDGRYTLRKIPDDLEKTPLIPNLDRTTLIQFIVRHGYPTVHECIQFLSPSTPEEADMVRKSLRAYCIIEKGRVIPRLSVFLEICADDDYVVQARDTPSSRSGDYLASYSSSVAQVLHHYNESHGVKPIRAEVMKKRAKVSLSWNGEPPVRIPRGVITVNAKEEILGAIEARDTRKPARPSPLRYTFTPDTLIMN